MRILGMLLAAGYLIAGCSEKSKEKETRQENNEQPRYEVKYTHEMKTLFELADAAEFPYAVDTTLLDSVIKYDSLNGKQVTWLYTALDTNALTDQVEYELESFFEIDSLKQAGKYADWAEQRNAGEMKHANAYILHKMHLNDSTDIITWAVTYGTYEACPYAAGHIVFATTFYNGTATSCTLVGEDMAAGDPPVGMSRLTTSTISAEGKISLHLKDVSYESDEEGEETRDVTNDDFHWKLHAGKIRLVRK